MGIFSQNQNEPQGYEPFIADPFWLCRRATAMRPLLSKDILILSGKGCWDLCHNTLTGCSLMAWEVYVCSMQLGL